MIELINAIDIKKGMFIDLEGDSILDPNNNNTSLKNSCVTVSAAIQTNTRIGISFEDYEMISVPHDHKLKVLKYKFGKVKVTYNCSGCAKKKEFGGHDHPTRFSIGIACPSCIDDFCKKNSINPSTGYR
jgi:hypothetical protein